MAELDDNSILDDIKDALGLSADYTPFDKSIIMFTNSAFATLNQIGVGPKETFRISNNSTKWSAFMSGEIMEEVKEYLYMKVRLMFDPPTLSFVITMIENQLRQAEFRMQVAHDKTFVMPVLNSRLPEDEVDWADA